MTSLMAAAQFHFFLYLQCPSQGLPERVLHGDQTKTRLAAPNLVKPSKALQLSQRGPGPQDCVKGPTDSETALSGVIRRKYGGASAGHGKSRQQNQENNGVRGSEQGTMEGNAHTLAWISRQ